ncbi:2-iminobutanoate/2-iminopropanoate deaminase-like isoform X2 [Thalassophryne amazonica]|uniref:2-iminobutanoate/2-iminopropanoate deaminase-like isoform X2 n=1 Tax=Thalassophryne amazonica TaxID=390379 RepID=UPI00147086D2|nr:2-iminobutanoate/2-iminopropanoate deaminase-like isoform X2 [Thalassophryne amazonica]
MAAIIRRIVSTSKAPAAIGPYSQAVVVDRTMYISGQLGMNPADGQLVEGGVQAQTKQALVNMGEILKVAGCGYENVVKTTVLLADMNDFTTVNNIYKQFFSTNFPARAAYQVAALPRGGLVEIEAVAVLGPLTNSS